MGAGARGCYHATAWVFGGSRVSINDDDRDRMTRSLPEETLLAIYGETIQPLYRYISRRVGGDASLAEDLVQDAWMRAIAVWPARGVPDEPLAWLIRVAHNVLVSHFRRQRPQLVDPIAIVEHAAPDQMPSDAAALVTWGLSRIRRAHAEILGAFYFEGKSVREIAAERAWSERAVEGRLRRARHKLEHQLHRVMPPAARDHAIKGGSVHARSTRTP